jgi:hypothetical protein
LFNAETNSKSNRGQEYNYTGQAIHGVGEWEWPKYAEEKDNCRYANENPFAKWPQQWAKESADSKSYSGTQDKCEKAPADRPRHLWLEEGIALISITAEELRPTSYRRDAPNSYDVNQNRKPHFPILKPLLEMFMRR